MSFTELKDEVLKLSLEERLGLARVLHGWEDDEWDKEMMADAKAGRFDEMFNRARADLDAGRARDLP